MYIKVYAILITLYAIVISSIYYYANHVLYNSYYTVFTENNSNKDTNSYHTRKSRVKSLLIKEEHVLHDNDTEHKTIAIKPYDGETIFAVADYYSYSTLIDNTIDTIISIPINIWRYEDIIIFHDTTTGMNMVKYNKFKQNIKIIKGELHIDEFWNTLKYE